MIWRFYFSLLAIAISSHFSPVNCDIFSSTAHLRSLMYLERHLISSLNDYVVQAQAKLNTVRTYLDEFSRTAGLPELRGKDSTEEIIGNPIQAFQLVKRLTVNWESLKTAMKTNEWQSVEQLVNDYSELLPTKEDLRGAALALVRLTDTYKLNMSDIARGRILDLPTKVQLTSRDCLYLGKHSFNNGYYGQALEWFDEALRKAHLERNRTTPVDEIIPFYNMAVQIHDELSPTYWTNISMILNNSRPPHTMRFLDGDNDDYRNYQELCRGEVFRTPAETKDLTCYYSNMGSKWLILQPVKVEVFHKVPFIAMFHDLLTDSESDTIREMAAPALTRAKVQTDSLKDDEISDTRTSQTTWFSEDDDELIDRINRRVSEVTGLSTKMNESHSELMQVANYGMGGHYTPHYDYLIVDRPPEERHLVPEREAYAGDRTATLMFYLSDVQKGGGTVFPRLGVSLKPRKNSAAFWYNLQYNGEAYEDTMHGACPVLLGEKWVANHWIREVGQAFRRKCKLNPDE
ncbi:prolyl 4-hydroxylase subunit alpha-2-like [Tetranychus urticae]|uniref:procollagen-proline 4-dioxygenase n=1 Tax=Tetranychus urticae TaxID=32264 RepID=T1KZ25_TETUR|nr:prolyl 4-hydroxylase subunit alpha-2-like [Tetranychus urticae]